jgi:uncharacterized membrane protein YgcG
MENQRRDFLKMTAAGAAGLALLKTDKAFAAWPASGTLAINPSISNTRVVSCYDTSMMKGTPTAMSFVAENAVVNSAQVQANMDAMAMQLANETTADAAWKAIFRSGKAWSSTKVAIKINTIEPKNMARLAVIQKFCTIFAGFGVPAANIIIYDGNTTYGAGISNYTSYFSATDATKTPGVVSSYNTALGGTANATIPGGTSAACSAAIANGTIDILVNIANNKGHTMMGKATLSMKNHFGTFAPNHDNNYVFNINKSDAILGGTPVRQQLCFIDSLIANKVSNTGTPEIMPCYLIMGVFGPVVDYLTVKKVREAVMNCTHDETIISQYLTSFGYAATDPVWVVVPPARASSGTGGSSGSGGSGSGGSSGNGGAGSGGSRASGGASGNGGSGSGGATGNGGAGSGGASGNGGAGSGGASSGSSGNGGIRGSGGASSEAGGSGNGGSSPAGGISGDGGASASTGGKGAAAGGTTSTLSAAGGSPATGGMNAGTGVTSSSSGGCDVVGLGRRTSPLGALLAVGAVVVGKLWRRAAQVESGDQTPADGTAQKRDIASKPLP